MGKKKGIHKLNCTWYRSYKGPMICRHPPRAPVQPFFDTPHQKWSEWKTNRSAVIAGRFRRKCIFFRFYPFLIACFRDPLCPRRQGGGSLQSSDLKTEGKQNKLLNRPAIKALRLVLHSDHFLCEVYAIPIPGHRRVHAKLIHVMCR